MKRISLVFLIFFLFLFISCFDEQSYVLNNENFFTISENGAVSLSENGRTSLNALYSSESVVFPFFKNRKTVCTVEIPEKINGIKVVEIAENGFIDCFCDQILFPSSIVKIGKNAFRNSDIKQIEIPESVKIIEDYAFYGLKTKSILNIKKNVEKIGCFAFFGIKHISLDSSNFFFKIIDGFLLSADETKLIFQTEDKSNLSFTLPNTVQIIEEGSCISGEEVTIPVSVREIKSYAFYSLNKLNYNGTMSGFEEIMLSELWIYNINSVSCLDGKINIRNSVDTNF